MPEQSGRKNSPFSITGICLAVMAAGLQAEEEIRSGQKKLQKCEKWPILNQMLHRAEKERRSCKMGGSEADCSGRIFGFFADQLMAV